MQDRAHRDAERRSFLATAIEVLNRSLHYQETLTSLARLAVPTIADWCAVDLLENGRLERLAVAHVDPHKADLANEIQRRFPPDPDAATGAPEILRSGKPELIPVITPEMLEAAPLDPAYLVLLGQLGLHSYIGVPLRRGDATIGVITLIMAESRRVYDEDDLALAIALADRAAVAIENARLYSDLERAHAQSASERDRLNQLIMSSPVGIAILRGPDLVFEVVNAEFRATFGGRELLGTSQAALDPSGEHSDTIRRVLETGEPLSEPEREVTYNWDGDGPESRYFSYSMAPMRQPNGTIDAVLVFSYDVTEQVLARKRVEEARTQAETANRAKDEFLAMLGHELRNPLAPILTALELMELRAPDVCERERTVIQRQVRHVVRLVDDLLDVSRITRGGVELHKEHIDLADTIGKAIEMASPLLEERNLELITAVPRGLHVDGDPVRLAQVVANLITNAAKYTERGGEIRVSSARELDYITIRVRDTGVGIAPEVLPKIFDTFYQARQAIDRAQGGLGLGLAIVRSLVELHGGTVAATSEGLGKGSEFSVTLPALAVAHRPRPALGTPYAGSRPLRHEKILVVDDNVDALSMLADALERRGFTTMRAHDAPSALAAAEAGVPHLALLDIGLPVMDGYELGRRLRQLPGLAGLVLVAVTGYGQPSDREKSAAAGFAAHLVKPISLDAVQATIDELTAPARASSTAP